MLTLYCWYFTVEDGHILAHGYVKGHPKLEDGCFVHTSAVEEALIENDVLLLTTRSGRLYTLQPENVSSERLESTEECLKAFQIETDLEEHFIQACLAADARRLEEAGKLLAPGQLLLELIGGSAIRAFFRNEDGGLFPVQPLVHVGMFQDSVLVTDRKDAKVDFRYLPMMDRLKPYGISEGLTGIAIHNLGTSDVVFAQAGGDRRCRAGEITVIQVGKQEVEDPSPSF